MSRSKAQSKIQGRTGNATINQLNVNFKSISGKRGTTIRPLTVDERHRTEQLLGLRSYRSTQKTQAFTRKQMLKKSIAYKQVSKTKSAQK